MPHTHPYEQLTPQHVLDLLETQELRGDGRLLMLNSYENRVFQVYLEDGSAVVAKFYRPERWTDAQILEEHAFAAELAAQDLPVVAPTPLLQQQTLAFARSADDPQGSGFRFAVYVLKSGHGPELDDPDTLRWLGRFIGRMHAVGSRQTFVHRRTLDAQQFGHHAIQRIEALDLLPPAQAPAWLAAARAALTMAEQALADVAPRLIRLHGDCHPGNILWRDPDESIGPDGQRRGGGPHIVDLDDAVNGPAIQDLWMLLSGSSEAMQGQLVPLLQGYRAFNDFESRELALIEPLRTLRMLHHSAWIAERWSDPAFPAAFPWFGSASYWGQQTTQLNEQLAAMAEPPLTGHGAH